MANLRNVFMKFEAGFHAGVKRAAELRGMSFSEFVRLAASEFAGRTYREYGEEAPDLNGWHMQKGGDTSEARAAKDKNYKKRKVKNGKRKSDEDSGQA